ncbi:MAG TPA: hypothetical protein IGR64_01155 [Leptolyngbyaceae cyanobacterium M65_K2018_010]|nr:hypothetical protein [Leptolyngbyaceae cyanobacterium M65_K2018_010]
MIFDRILEDILGFIRRLLWWQADPQADQYKPFQSMQKIEGDYGVIALVEGRDTPRAVRSWIYGQKRLDLNSTRMVAKAPLQDIHIYLDFLGPLPGSDGPRARAEVSERQKLRKQGRSIKTHRLQVLKASHFLNPNGFYDYELVFWADYDFYLPNGLEPDKLARILTDKLAYQCLTVLSPLDLESHQWEAMIEEIWKQLRGPYAA